MNITVFWFIHMRSNSFMVMFAECTMQTGSLRAHSLKSGQPLINDIVHGIRIVTLFNSMALPIFVKKKMYS